MASAESFPEYLRSVLDRQVVNDAEMRVYNAAVDFHNEGAPRSAKLHKFQSVRPGIAEHIRRGIDTAYEKWYGSLTPPKESRSLVPFYPKGYVVNGKYMKKPEWYFREHLADLGKARYALHTNDQLSSQALNDFLGMALVENTAKWHGVSDETKEDLGPRLLSFMTEHPELENIRPDILYGMALDYKGRKKWNPRSTNQISKLDAMNNELATNKLNHPLVQYVNRAPYLRPDRDLANDVIP